ncbi:MAG: hypothetical protein HZB38_15775 [Planctomycetes bacterium]|nr:hypothetical protein [Planctomycetota bacterium]
MFRAITGLILAATAFTSRAHADARLRMDLLDPTDGGSQAPNGRLIIDFMVSVDSGDTWIVGALSITAVGGSRIAYSYHLPEEPSLTNPGSSDPFVTCVSVPLPRFGAARFDNAIAATLGRNCPFGVGIISTPVQLAMEWYDPRPCVNLPTASGAIARIAVDVDPALRCDGDLNCCYALYPLDQIPDGASPILEGNCESHDDPPYGVAFATCDHPLITWTGWVLALTPMAGSCRFDFNRDRTIDIGDLSLLLAAFGSTSADPEFQTNLDFDGNQVVDLQDLSTFLAHWGAF